jgi:hypothetical protein
MINNCYSSSHIGHAALTVARAFWIPAVKKVRALTVYCYICHWEAEPILNLTQVATYKVFASRYPLSPLKKGALRYAMTCK